jgi:hypothetical protein
VFADAFLPNLFVFLIGQIAAFGWLRHGCLRAGVLTMVAIWVFADSALVVRFAYEDHGSAAYLTTLLAMQGSALASAGWLLTARVRRRLGHLARHRSGEFARGQTHYLRSEWEPARRVFVRLVRHDPWDVPSRVSLAAVLVRQGKARQARRMLAAARRFDRAHGFHDLIDERLRRLRQG